ncbi:glycosyltransferase family 4 protein [Tuberibacillus sp. Marseille-P3662]|uniref:glycosyltransferase family 4 protein n=1 Tax=Tuberibacillus sp. Marseille-P3662 TaxID=1965358 RepID=UPI000A1CCCB9|nr:glycosyltransferase family 1 protein [Tuberibacillus sp. Marseille-P3662]
MKIAIVTETFLPSTDGIVTRLCHSIRWIQEQGHEVLIIAPDLGVKEFEGAKVVGIPARSFFLYKGHKKFAYPNRKIGRALKQFAPDLVHVVNPALMGAAGMFYGRWGKWPLVASYHTHIPKYADYYRVSFVKPVLWWYFRLLHNRADLNLCTSQSVASELKEQRFKNVEVWKRGVDTERFHPDFYSEDMRHRLSNGNPAKTLLLYVGRLAAEKEIEKIRDCLDRNPDFGLAIVGDGPYRASLEDHFQGRNVVFTGFLHGDELSQAFASSDAFVFPSTTETLGLVILEAMASGLPMVAAKSGPTCEQVEDGVSGLLYDPEVPGDFVKTLEKLNDKSLRDAISEQAREVSADLGWSGQSKQLLDFYHQVLQEKGAEWVYEVKGENDH